MHLLTLPAALSLITFTSALPTLHPDDLSKPLPLLIWHGLGDRYDADGLQSTGALAQKVHPGTFVYYVRTDDDGGNDRTNSFFGNVTTYIADVCEALHRDPRLVSPDDSKTLRVDALGFSQGGQFLRGLIERCDGLSVRSLVTFGSQHNGIAEFQECGAFDFLCKGATALVKGNAWTEYVQNKVVPAQYYRTVNETTGLASNEYLAASNFLADVNNERDVKNETYARRIAALEKFVMFVFEDDTTVIPKETGWFAEVNATSGKVTPLQERKMYKEDWLGLKELDEKDGLVFKIAPGGHMDLEDEGLLEVFEEYFGPERGRESEKILLPYSMTMEEFGRLSEEGKTDFQERLMLLEQQNRICLLAKSGRTGWCCTDRAQAWWDSLSWWEKQTWHWKHVTLPWLRGEWVPISNDSKAHESL